MYEDDYPVKMYCPISRIEETVYFQPKERDGKLTARLSDFNGCNHNFSSCEACKVCAEVAFDKMERELRK